MRRVSSLALLALALAGCDAGHREDPGRDNRAPGPQLAIVAPAPEQVLAAVGEEPVLGADGQPTGSRRRVYAWPKALFDLRYLAPVERKRDVAVWFALDGGPAQRVADPTRPVDLAALLPAPAGSGSHVLQAWVARADGTPFANPEAAAVRHFHLGQEDGAFDVRYEGGENPRGPFVERDPHLIVVAPPRETPGPRLLVAATGVALGRTHRLKVEAGGRTGYAAAAGALDLRALEGLGDLPAGEVAVTVSLEARSRAGWAFVPGPFNRETRPVVLP